MSEPDKGKSVEQIRETALAGYADTCMRTRQYCLLRPEEILAEKERHSVIYLPVGPLEWHGPALPLGTDGISAEKAAAAAAERTGGVVLPTLWCGTFRSRDAADLAKQQFDDHTARIVGMDYPCATVKSFYAREEIFATVIREHLRLLVEHGYALIVIVTGHGGEGFYDVMERLCDEASHDGDSRAVLLHAWADSAPPGEAGHATRIETSLMLALTDSVKLDTLPVEPEKLRYQDYGMLDDVYTDDGYVKFDPRTATADEGSAIFAAGVKNIIDVVNALLEKGRNNY